jgi:hypothetical protein
MDAENNRIQKLLKMTEHVVQAHIFDGKYERQDIGVFEYLKSAKEIISFKMMERLVEVWCSQRLEWHLDRGLKVSTDGKEYTKGNLLTKQMFLQFNPQRQKDIRDEAFRSHFLISSFKPGDMTAYQACSNQPVNSSKYSQELHCFMAN